MKIVRTVKLTFRTTPNVKRWLERRARENSRSLNSELEMVLLAAKSAEYTAKKSEPL